MDITILDAEAQDDLLIVRGTIEGVEDVAVAEDGTESRAPRELTATGWVSAMTNHFDVSAIGKDGHRLASAKPREMSDAEKIDYMRSLLTEAHAPARAATPVKLKIAGMGKA